MSRRQYPFHLIEPKWQARWDAEQTFRAFNPGEAVPAGHPFGVRHGLAGRAASAAELPPKFYILDMFPYPSGAGLHVGHPEGYTATDILARWRRAQGRHVLHPMGWDSFGLPAEQYAVKTGQHPRVTTEANIANFTRQIRSLGFSYDWSREVATTDPEYFRWTQWIFLQLYNAWFKPETNQAEPISTLSYPADCDTEEKKRAYRDSKRLAYVSEAPVNWCPELGTVLANEEVMDGRSEVGGFPVIRRPMRQWMLRITAYAERLLADLDTIDWSDSLKEMQRNWIGRSEGAEVDFQVDGHAATIRVFTTRPDTLFGATYMVLSPEHKLVPQITTPGQRKAAEDYRIYAAGKSDLERTELAKEKTGVFTGAHAINPVNREKIPIWIADYVLVSYGTGAIMAVPAHDERDWEFAKRFDLSIKQVVIPKDLKPITLPDGKQVGGAIGPMPKAFCEEGIAFESPESGWRRSDPSGERCDINGLPTAEAKSKITAWLEEKGLGKKTINYKLRDWLFSRQRYWGEPFPIIWRKDTSGHLHHESLPESALPVLPPALEDYKPTPDGQPPLARATDWVNLPDGSIRETNTMPQWAGSCWYYLRYLDARRSQSFCGPLAERYWMGSPVTGLLLSDSQWRNRLAELAAHAAGKPESGKRFITYAVVGPAEAERLKSWTGLDLGGFRRFLDDQAINHILNEHGDAVVEGRLGQLPVTLEDIALIPQVVSTPDRVSHGGRTRRHLDAVLYEKRINGFLCCVEEVREGTGLLAVKTLYKRQTTGAHAVAGLDQTSETFRRSEGSEAATATAVNPPSIISQNPSLQPAPGVDLYVGGTEHAVLHLLYARFWHKVLFDLGHVSTPEPFFKLVNQGLILGEDGQKMSKSRGNVVNPDDVLQEYGADAFRLYEMFMGPLQDTKPWNTQGVEGVYRFLGRVWRLFVDEKSETAFEQAETVATEAQRRGELLDLILLDGAIQEVAATPAQLKALHACIKKVTDDLEGLRFNTAISAMMVFVNEANGWQARPFAVLRTFLQLLAPFAPHLAEELWARLHATFGQTPPSLSYAPWPVHDPALLVEDTLEIPVQVNGKLRDVIRVPAAADQAALEAAARANGKLAAFLAGKTVRKVIVVPRKLVNFVVG